MLYGTNWINKPVTISHVLEVVYSLPPYLEGEDKPPFAYTNIAGVIKEYCLTSNIKPTPFVREEMCSASDQYEMRAWCQSLDLCLHDAAVYHTFEAARSTVETGVFSREWHARIACDLWIWSRQLRVDYTDHFIREYYCKQQVETAP